MSLVVDETRPYEPLGMTTERWQGIAPSWLPFFDALREGIVFSQHHLRILDLLEPSPPLFDGYPHLIHWRGSWYVSDGHHRIARELISGNSGCWVRALDDRLCPAQCAFPSHQHGAS